MCSSVHSNIIFGLISTLNSDALCEGIIFSFVDRNNRLARYTSAANQLAAHTASLFRHLSCCEDAEKSLNKTFKLLIRNFSTWSKTNWIRVKGNWLCSCQVQNSHFVTSMLNNFKQIQSCFLLFITVHSMWLHFLSPKRSWPVSGRRLHDRNSRNVFNEPILSPQEGDWIPKLPKNIHL